jgi:Zn-dependent protease
MSKNSGRKGKILRFALFGISAILYSLSLGWKIGLIIMISISLHEIGHLFAMKRRGMKVKGVYFIPFLGAIALPEEKFNSYETENYTAIMGPTFGLITSLLTYLLFVFTGKIEFAGAAGWIALINFFNFLPIMPLDGGRVLRSIVFSFNLVGGIILTTIGTIIGTIICVNLGWWLGVLIMTLGIAEVIDDLLTEKDTAAESELNPEIHLAKKMSKSQIIKRIAWALTVFFGLLFIIKQASLAIGGYAFLKILK